jgi:hypothetical protein
VITIVAALILCAAPPAARAADPDPEPPLKAPLVKFQKTDFYDGERFLVFEVSNPNKKPISFYGYGGQKSYQSGSGIVPMHKVQRRVGKVWAAAEPWSVIQAPGEDV